MNKHWRGGQSSFVGICGLAGERACRRARLLITTEPSPFLAPLAPALILLLMEPRGELGQGWRSTHPPPLLPRVLRNLLQPSLVEGVHQLGFPSMGPGICSPHPSPPGSAGPVGPSLCSPLLSTLLPLHPLNPQKQKGEEKKNPLTCIVCTFDKRFR